MLTSTERPMFGPIQTGLAHRMDEPILDCFCGADGVVELQAQVLDDSLSWMIYSRTTKCAQHALTLLEALLSVEPWPHARIVLIRL